MHLICVYFFHNVIISLASVIKNRLLFYCNDLICWLFSFWEVSKEVFEIDCCAAVNISQMWTNFITLYVMKRWWEWVDTISLTNDVVNKGSQQKIRHSLHGVAPVYMFQQVDTCLQICIHFDATIDYVMTSKEKMGALWKHGCHIQVCNSGSSLLEVWWLIKKESRLLWTHCV